jgi:glycosyltransferase involved in cell wall biosynthesis
VPENATVLRVLTRLNVGGPSRHALLLTRELADRHPTVLAAGVPAATEGSLSDPALEVHPLPLVRPLRPATDLRAVAASRALLRDVRPRILHTHMAKAGSVGRTAALTLRDRPVLIHTFHGHVLDGYFSRGVSAAFVAVERALARRTDVLVAVSDEIRDQLLELGIGRPEQWRTIPLGLDLDDLLDRSEPSGVLRRELGIGDAPLIGMLGRLVPIKDIETALRAVARVPDAHLALVGDGDERASLEALRDELGLSARVHFLGWRHDIGDVLTDLDVALLTSRNEGTPVALIEAAAAGRPAVATDVGGVRAVVDDGVTGIVVPPGDVDAIAAALGTVLGDTERAAQLGAAGRDHVRDRFSGARLVADIGALYDELLRG